MGLTQLTKITGPGIKTDTNWVGNNALFTGITTFSNLISSEFDADIINTKSLVGTGLSIVGVVTATSANFTSDVKVGSGVTIEQNGQATFTGIVTFGSNSTTIGDNVINVGTALTLGHTQGVQFHTQNLHADGFEINNINASGIVTASQFKGDGSELTGVSGFSTALSNDTTSLLNLIFKTNVQHNVAAGTSVTIQSDAGSGNIAFTRLSRINVATGATIRVAAGTTFLMNVLNVF